jgi:hypothetical protein
MLHKRCDIKSLIDDMIRVRREIINTSPDAGEVEDAIAEEGVLQEVRDGIFDERLPP